VHLHELLIFLDEDDAVLTLVVYSLNNSTLGTLVQIIKLAHILLANLKVVDFCILLDSAGCIALGERDLLKSVSIAGFWKRKAVKGTKKLTHPFCRQ
jgi:hypothetical protein